MDSQPRNQVIVLKCKLDTLTLPVKVLLKGKSLRWPRGPALSVLPLLWANLFYFPLLPSIQQTGSCSSRAHTRHTPTSAPLRCLFYFNFGCAGSALMHRFSPVAASSGYSLIARGLFIAVASPFVEHGFQDSWASAVAARGLSSCGSQVLEGWLSSCSTWA